MMPSRDLGPRAHIRTAVRADPTGTPTVIA